MSSNNKKYYRTVFKIEVLSSEPIKDGIGLKEIANEIYEGHYSGMFLDDEVEECDEKRITELLENQGSDASFLIEELWDD
tara:strand:+ start:723 stop:962 length:240 start_codon:yes stop_codon:yes gene_type:complete